MPRTSLPLYSLSLPLAALLTTAPSLAAEWQDGNYGGNLKMIYYVPDNVDDKPAMVLSLHYCSGNETASKGWFTSFADEYGFVIVSPKSPGNCWDSAPGRSGDRAQLAQMIDWAVENHDVDPTRVFAAGASSGACMSATMLASYPDKVAAASVLAGVPVGFWSGGNECGVCSQQVASNQTDWGARALSAGPANYMGSRGRIQLFHAVQDQYLGSGNFAVLVKQWSDVLDVVGEGVEEANSPRSGWTRTSYKNAEGVEVVQGNWWGNSPPNSHDLTSNINPPLWNEVVSFFGLDVDAPPVDETSGETASSAPPDPSTTTETSTAATDTSTAATTTTTSPTSTSPNNTSPTNTSTNNTSTNTATVPVDPTTPATTTVSPTATSNTTPSPTSSGQTTATGAPTTTTSTNTATAPSDTAATPSDDSGEDGCQCRLGKVGQPLGSIAGFLAAGLATFARRRRRHR